MPIETDADRAAFFDPTEWGESAVYTPAGGQAVDVTVVRGRAHEIADLGVVGINLPAEKALIRASEVAAPAPGDTLDIGDVVYRVERADQDATATLWTLSLSRTGS